MKCLLISHIRTEPILKILAVGGPKITKKWPNRQNLDIRFPPDPHSLGINLQNWLNSYLGNWDIFHLRPVPSKNIENCALENFLKKIFFEKKFFGVSGIPRNRKGVKNFWFQKSLGIILMVILSLYWGNLGVKWRNGVAYKSKNAKIEIGLNTPLLRGKLCASHFLSINVRWIPILHPTSLRS